MKALKGCVVNRFLTIAVLLFLNAPSALASSGQISLLQSDGGGISTNMTALIVVTMLAMIPTFIFTASPFLRIVIVFGILRQASGLTTAPSNKVLAAMALVVSMYIMKPTFTEIHEKAILPFESGQMTELQAIDAGGQVLKSFMLRHTKKKHIERMLENSGEEFTTKEEIAFDVVWISFMISEIETALKIGFMLYLPFLAVDLITGSILMSLGMMMLSPMVVSLPIKILLFVTVDGWLLTVDGLANSYVVGAG